MARMVKTHSNNTQKLCFRWSSVSTISMWAMPCVIVMLVILSWASTNGKCNRGKSHDIVVAITIENRQSTFIVKYLIQHEQRCCRQNKAERAWTQQKQTSNTGAQQMSSTNMGLKTHARISFQETTGGKQCVLASIESRFHHSTKKTQFA